MKRIQHIFFALLLSLLLGMSLRSAAQVTVSGIACVVPGITYQYTIVGNWNSSSTMHVCLTGGKMSGSGNTCTPNGAPIGYVQVIWDTVTNGVIKISSSSGDSSLTVTIAKYLDGGSLMDSSGNQSISYNSLADTIHCSAATGGSCSPHYQYLWQQSLDKIHFSDIDGATDRDCVLPFALQQTIYCRRTTKETISNLIAYSDIAMIVVTVPIPETQTN